MDFGGKNLAILLGLGNRWLSVRFGHRCYSHGGVVAIIQNPQQTPSGYLHDLAVRTLLWRHMGYLSRHPILQWFFVDGGKPA